VSFLALGEKVRYLATALSAAYKSYRPPSAAFEQAIAGDGSSDGSAARCRIGEKVIHDHSSNQPKIRQFSPFVNV
jgi:hypothetical protein